MPLRNGHTNAAYSSDEESPARNPSANGKSSRKPSANAKASRKPSANGKASRKQSANGKASRKTELTNGVDEPTSKNGSTNGHVIPAISSPDLSISSLTTSKPSTECGLWCFKPKWLQKLAHPLVFVLCHSLLTAAQSILVSGYIAGSISTIEKRYKFQSVQSGAIVSSYEVTCIIGVILVSYIGDKFNRAHWLSYGAFVISIGSFLFVLPHAIGGRYQVGVAGQNSTSQIVCSAIGSRDLCSAAVSQEESWAMSIFIVAMLVIGFGASPVYTLGPTFLYDNCKRSNYGLFIGIVYCCAAIGPAAGFLMSALFLSYFVDISVTTDLNEDDPQWVGAWWLGFIVCGFLNLLAAVPLLFFPRSLPARFSSDNNGNKDELAIGSMKSSFKELPLLVKSIFSNLPWLFVSLAAVMEASVATGFVTFVAKFLQVTYGLPASRSSIITGGVVIPGACSGIMFGGYLMKRFKLPLSGVAKLCCLVSSTCILFYIVVFFLGCNTLPIAGVTAQYPSVRASGSTPTSTTPVVSPALLAPCNQNCRCSAAQYQPVCGSDGMTYYNPCYAGCTSSHAYSNGVQNFTSCACVNRPLTGSPTASDGACAINCQNLVPLLVVLFIIVVISFINQNPALLITLGCVEQHERSFALGLQSFLVRILAYIPAPIYFGYLFDSQCVLWQERCGARGACIEYNRSTLPAAIFGLGLALKMFSLLFTVFVWLSSRNKDQLIVHDSQPDLQVRRKKRSDVIADLTRRLTSDSKERYVSTKA